MGEIRFVGTGETRGYPYLVCKKLLSFISNIFLILATGLFQFLTNILVFNDKNGQANNKDDV